MDNINLPSGIICIGIIVVLIVAFAILLIVGIIRVKKKKNLKTPIIIFVLIAIVLSGILGCITLNNHIKDNWFYPFKNAITNQYNYVDDIDFNAGKGGLSLFVYCKNGTETQKVEPVFSTIKNYLFNNPSGSNPSQQSYLKRGQGEYTKIYIFFYIKDKKDAITQYEAGYYTDGLRTKIDNFLTWYIEKNGQMTQLAK